MTACEIMLLMCGTISRIDFSSFSSFKPTVDYTDLTPFLSCYYEV